VTCTVVRNRGDDGAVNVTWAVFLSGSAFQADSDFVNSSGILSFEAGERRKVTNIDVMIYTVYTLVSPKKKHK
jgi:hypothetical protein